MDESMCWRPRWRHIPWPVAVAGVALLLPGPAPAAPPVEFAADVVLQADGGQATLGHYWQKGDLIRVKQQHQKIVLQRGEDGRTRPVVSAADSQAPPTVRIIDHHARRVMFVDDTGKRYIPFRKPTVEADMLPVPAIDWGLDLLLPVDQGTETIQGYECDHTEYYGTKAGAELKGLPRVAQEALATGGGELPPEKAAALMRALKPGDLRAAVGRLSPDQRRLKREVWVARKLGRAIRHVAHGLGGEQIVTEFVNIREGGLDPALFQPPAGYASVRSLQPLPESSPSPATAPSPGPVSGYPAGSVPNLVPKGAKATLRIVATLGGQPARAWVNVTGEAGREHLRRWPTGEGGILELSVPAGTYSVEATMDQVLGGAVRRVDGVTVDGVETVEMTVAVQAGFLNVVAEKNGTPCAARVFVISTAAEERWWPRDTDGGGWPLALAPGAYRIVVRDKADATPPASGQQTTVQIEAGKTAEVRRTL